MTATSVQLIKHDNGIHHFVLDRPEARANLMDQQFTNDFAAATELLLASDWRGLVIRSAKDTFFAGGDLTALSQVNDDNAPAFFEMVETLKRCMRRLETAGKPVVAAINGAALGGGWEMCLFAHHRVALNRPHVKMGLPEVTLGLLPGAGGVTRTVRLLGLQTALPLLTEGKQLSPERALKAGLIHELADDQTGLIARAEAWAATHPEVSQPWDEKGYKIPGGTPSQPAVARTLPIVPAMVRAKTHGCLPAPEKILACAVEGAQVDFDTATRIESRYIVELARGQVCKNLINTFWFQLNDIKAGKSRPPQEQSTALGKVAVLGAGMMGAGIAYQCATNGIEVVLKDIDKHTANKGKEHARALLQKRIERGALSEAEAESILARIHATDIPDDLANCELVIEAVFENRELKENVTREAQTHLPDTAIIASNTSTLPITGLARAAEHADRFIGLHFFSPVEKMPLVEIIRGAQTSDATLAQAYDFVQQIRKTPIVVNDSRGFFTSRVFGTFTHEGMAMLAEGIHPALIENAAFLAGFPVGPLAVVDEVSLTLLDKVRRQTQADLRAEGQDYPHHSGEAVLDRMLELNRHGKAAGQGFYQYPAKGQKHLWPELVTHFDVQPEKITLQNAKDRLLYIMALETLRCYQAGVINTVRDANIGSIFGIGFPAWTGGALQFVNQTGLQEFLARAESLAETYGERFTPPEILINAARDNTPFSDSGASDDR
ncbi:3-hydroxyacyl-CoA dehydrogenase NAD-binding domain-containing protein [Simiduia aestuariiviva]|uniref:3-hydroxyacyl-CoA dehydrogenase/enoyl-CoA hydratase/3-hydroxybutyryl-CoA epimerase n=1 Tax=Simiduia aestuariiviva TaxID=1510459 RepID=A0A839UHE4_9GAMM|nr:3-hydroxyacyl-CoA dehydrogenase NAD-binding domain-containing protein [Simiduia aestuariiviva]MBB3166873.1 3-hydroxyacyl-CoA dehydrogenase/enoyl-CoA hydratase/3-hydroxybutyryl-CoA epimerase [Simiduia aestuariiviva]